ncbi:MAG TPA: hypothetical protein VFO62_10695 [Candidatus Binatia bacterium]|nr:hypothetical protein [Candidatus Binatia bacterium]
MRNPKLRRLARQVLRHGRNAKRRHRKIAGRTGAIESKRTPGKHYGKGVVSTVPRSVPSLPPWLQRKP